MTQPWWAYILGLLLALPVFALVGVFAALAVRGVAQWLTDDGTSMPGR